MIPVHQLEGRVLIDWHECESCFCLVRPKKQYCCIKCKKMPGSHTDVLHYRKDGDTEELALMPKVLAILSTPFFCEDPVKVSKEDMDRLKDTEFYKEYTLEPDPRKVKQKFGLDVYEDDIFRDK